MADDNVTHLKSVNTQTEYVLDSARIVYQDGSEETVVRPTFLQPSPMETLLFVHKSKEEAFTVRFENIFKIEIKGHFENAAEEEEEQEEENPVH